MSRRLPLWGIVVGTAMAVGCTAVPYANALVVSRNQSSAPAHAVGTRLQLGVDIDFYSYKGMDPAKFAGVDMAYVKSLNANAVSISFPFFMPGPRSSRIYATAATPSPSQLGAVVQSAQADGLRVTIRPLLSEYNLRISRVKWKPREPAKWFRNYLHFLLPYAQMARALNVPDLIVGSEFSRFGNSKYWKYLDTGIRRVYKGKLVYDGNGIHGLLSKSTLRNTGEVETVDAYPTTNLRNSATQAKVSRVLSGYGHRLPRRIVISEVGIAAQNGAYKAPWRPSWPGEGLRSAIQVRWFTGMCDAVARDHLGGIYFWAMNFGQPLDQPPTVQHPAAFVDGHGAAAIAACFQHLSS